jgi:O-antigen biosynthesis protein
VEPAEELRTWQPDLYQRYELLRRVLQQAFPAPGDRPVSVVDVGSGPERLSERALGSGYMVTRTDVGDFDDPDIVRLHAGAPLPFDTDSCDVVVAMDVLEHVPAVLRPSLIDECSRVARHLVVVACPTDDEDVRAAEEELATVADAVSGRKLAFLEEHAAHGLPSESGIAGDLERTCGAVAVLTNAPLSNWSAMNSVDFVVNLRVGDPEVKQRVNRTLNVDPVLCRAGEPGYRKFFIGSPTHSIDVARLSSELRDESTETQETGPDPMSILLGVTEALSSEIRRQRAVAEQIQAQSAAAVQQLDGRLAVRDLENSSLRAAERRAVRSNESLLRTIRELDDRLRVLQDELSATKASFEHLPATPALPSPPPPALARRIASRARRSPRWVGRKARSAVHRLRAAAHTPAPPATPHTGAPARFDRHWYLLRNPDVREAGGDPWDHYLRHGRFEGRSAHPLFDAAWYCEEYPDSCVDGNDPFMDWATTGLSARRNPNEFFDTEWYLRRHPEVAEHGLDPVEHYRLHGWREGRRPGPLFDPSWYRGTYPDVAGADIDPLTHFVQFGRNEGRHANHLEHIASSGSYRPADGLIPWFSPVNFSVEPSLAEDPRLNVLVPGMGVRHLTGGPNTAIQLAYRLAAAGQAVRFIATDAALDDDTEPLWTHMAAISDVGVRLPNVEVIDGSDRFRPVDIGENDVFMATAWWTAQSIKAALPLVRHQKFLYLIQDFEPLFFASSSQYALALETYGLDHVPVVNSRFLLEHLAQQQVGRFADQEFVDAAIVFEPTVDRTLFRPAVPTSTRQQRRLLFYARPQNGLRNLFELGVAALQMAVQRGVLAESEWEFWGMGEQFEPVAVGPRSVLNPLPWKDFEAYAEQMRESDILLSPMLAPHPSYPPLEMAACGGLTVTTEFGPKTAAALSGISGNIIGTPATIEGLAQGLADAVERLDDLGSRFAGCDLALPENWHDVFEPVLPEIESRIRRITDGTEVESAPPSGPMDRYGRWRTRRIADRVEEYPAPQVAGVTFSLMTPVWNTAAPFLRALAESVRSQDLHEGWEWVIADNGSTDPETLSVLDELEPDPRIRLIRHDVNLGILGGMRSCLDHASGRYVVHLDHDDLLTPDALRVVAAILDAAGWPTAFYSDEDKLRGTHFLEPYLKPDWDPVLFVNSCYIAHLCGVDRQTALELDAYSDPGTEASPDWDLFMRLATTGIEPLHIAEVLYSWRIHDGSTAGDSRAKPYALETHRRVLERFVEHSPVADRFAVQIHPDSPDGLDWWIRREKVDARPLVSIVVGTDGQANVEPVPSVDHQIHAVAVDEVEQFAAIVKAASERGALVHVLNSSATMLRSEWYWEALGLMELHAGVVAVGGPLVHHDRIVSAGDVFGFGPDGWGSPACGEPALSPGWFAQNLKQRSVDGLVGDHIVYDSNRLRAVLAEASVSNLATLGPAFSFSAADVDERVVYSPLFRAHVARPFLEQWSDTERVAIGTSAANHASGRTRSEHLSLESTDPFTPILRSERRRHLAELAARTLPPTITYHDWLVREIDVRSDRYPVPPAGPSVSVITPVYAGTDVGLLDELASCLAAQTAAPREWIIGIDGELPDDLQRLIDRLAASDRVRTTGGAKVGILGTMLACLEQCSGDYVVPVDADDLLTPDALAILTSVAASEGLPDLVHSDEDVLDGDRFRDPFLRPDWDPVLHLASSYVWHALCVKRTTALELGLYTDPSYEWCHDWDTVERIRRAGGTIVHVPEVLYHWRRHSGSSTNTDRPESAQQDSVKAMFTRMAGDTGHPERYEVAEFPLWRGAAELHLRRLHTCPPDICLLSLGPLTGASRLAVIQDAGFPFETVYEGPDLDERVSDLAEFFARMSSDFVWLLDGDTVSGGYDPIWEAAKWIELVADVVAVCGRAVDERGIVSYPASRFAALVASPSRSLPVERSVEDPGPYAVALKPQSINRIDLRSCLVRRSPFLRALTTLDPNAILRECEIELSDAISGGGGRISYSPLIMRHSARHPFPDR